MRVNSLTINCNDFHNILSHLHNIPNDKVLIEIEKKITPDKQEFICKNISFHPILTLEEDRLKYSLTIELGLAPTLFVKSGYFPVMLNLWMYNNIFFLRNFFVYLLLEDTFNPELLSGLIFFEDTIEPFHFIEVLYPDKRKVIPSSDFKNISVKNSSEIYISETKEIMKFLREWNKTTAIIKSNYKI